MLRNRYLLPLGVSMLGLLQVYGDAQGGVWAPITDEVEFKCVNGNTTPGYSVYVVGNHPKLGNWDPAKAVKLNDKPDYPTWTGKVLFPGADDGKDVEWKCIVRSETVPTDVQKWQGNPNNIVKLAFTAKSVGSF
ncbi:carbohydrate-binding module family 20 domain-containing protein [Pseudomonas sp.]|uniref:carbohydrate-binding module family 20 domain-containing protein n=1 Tax=Pseudomonas sp. TaxID=306 RepID=UPI003F3366D2